MGSKGQDYRQLFPVKAYQLICCRSLADHLVADCFHIHIQLKHFRFNQKEFHIHGQKYIYNVI